MRVSTSTSILHHIPNFRYSHTVPQAIRICAKAGFRNLDMNFFTNGSEGCALAQDDWEQWVDEVKATAEECNIQFKQSHGYCYRTVEFYKENPALPWFGECIRRSIIASKRLGVSWIVIHPLDLWATEVYSAEDNKELNLAYWRPFVTLAEELGVGIAFENMFQSGKKQRYCSEVEELIDLVKSFDSPAVGICWDTGHASLAGQPQRESLRKIGSLLKAMHINDNHAIPKGDEHLTPYLGVINWQEVMYALHEIEFSGDFAFELKQATNYFPPALGGDMVRFIHQLGEHLVNTPPEEL